MAKKSKEYTHKYIIGFYVGMHDIALLQKGQRKKDLLGVSSDSRHAQANILAETFDNFPQVHATG